jgi:hypothetical protein
MSHKARLPISTLKSLKFHPYKIILQQELHGEDFQKRTEFAILFKNRMVFILTFYSVMKLHSVVTP